MSFQLTALVGGASVDDQLIVDICDVKAPPSVRTIHLDHIELNLSFIDAVRSDSGANSAAASSPSSKHSQKSTGLRRLAREESGSSVWSNNRQTDDTFNRANAARCNVDHFVYLALKALHHVFEPRSSVLASFINLVSTCKASRLADIAPVVFVPEYSQILNSRQKLIPIIAQCLFAFQNRRSKSAMGFDGRNDRYTDRYGHSRDWFQENLWSYMVTATKRPTGVRKSFKKQSKSNISANDSSRSLEVPRVSHVAEDHQMEEYSEEEEEEDDFLIQEAEQDSTAPLLFDLYEAMLERPDVLRVTTEDAYISSCKPHMSENPRDFPTNHHDLVSDRKIRAHCKRYTTTLAGSRSSSRNNGVSGLADCADELLTHMDDHGKGLESIMEAHEMPDPTGQGPLTHHACSTWPVWTNELENPRENMIEDVLISYQAQPLIGNTGSDSLIDTRDEAQDLLFSHDQGSRIVVQEDEQQISSQSTDRSHCSELQMAAQQEQHSLSEVLGNDQFLWNMWQRRKSTAPPAEDEMLEMHHMFENDPDMRVLSTAKAPEPTYADLMMFDSFNFSRKSSRSEATSPNSSTNEDLDPFLGSAASTQSSKTLTLSRNSITSPNEAKQPKRRSSVLKMIKRPAKLSKGDIQFQQQSPTRDVDIKKRKTLSDYHHDGR